LQLLSTPRMYPKQSLLPSKCDRAETRQELGYVDVTDRKAWRNILTISSLYMPTPKAR
jgi:hypothetical protein